MYDGEKTKCAAYFKPMMITAQSYDTAALGLKCSYVDVGSENTHTPRG